MTFTEQDEARGVFLCVWDDATHSPTYTKRIKRLWSWLQIRLGFLE